MEETSLKNRWLPPSPHREEIFRRIEAGRAYIQERGHNTPPLLIFEDGGVIELPQVRYSMTLRGMELVADGDGSIGQTKHNDVCGTVEELKGLFREDPSLLNSDPEHFYQLLDNAQYMISRMHRRYINYKTFTSEIASLIEKLTDLKSIGPEQAYQKSNQIHSILKNDSTARESRLEELDDLAEGVRDVASNLEQTLAKFKDVAVEMNLLYEKIKGGRNWDR